MKKVLSVLLAIIFAFSSLGASMAVFAADSQKNKLIAHLDEQIKGAANFAFKGVTFTEQNAGSFLTYINSGADTSAYKSGFLNSLKANLDKNGGKIIIAGENWYQDDKGEWQSYSYSYEDIGAYGAVILCLEALGYNPADFEGYNIVSALQSVDMLAEYNLYGYRAAILADTPVKDTLALKLVADHYTENKGANYYANGSGSEFYNCDNTCVFVTALAAHKEQYKTEIENAKAVIQSYTKEDGAFCDDSEWGSAVNADSTALALMAYASLGELDKAFEYYEDLVSGFESSTGVFQSAGFDNAYATEEALLAFEYFKTAIEKQNYEHPRHIYTETVTTNATTKEDGCIKGNCTICGEEKVFETIAKPKKVTVSKASYKYTGKKITPKVTVKDSNGKKIDSKYYTVKYYNNKSVGKATIKVTFKDLYSGTLTKTFKIIPKNVTKFAVKKGKKSFTASWKKQTKQTTGYQLQYSTKENFKSKKTITFKNNKVTERRVKGLKSNKTYYVRIRSYKTVGKKKYYSSWSKVKPVKTK